MSLTQEEGFIQIISQAKQELKKVTVIAISAYAHHKYNKKREKNAKKKKNELTVSKHHRIITISAYINCDAINKEIL